MAEHDGKPLKACEDFAIQALPEGRVRLVMDGLYVDLGAKKALEVCQGFMMAVSNAAYLEGAKAPTSIKIASPTNVRQFTKKVN